MDLLFTAILLAALALQVWPRLSQAARMQARQGVLTMVGHIRRVADAARGRIFRRRLSWRHLFMDDAGRALSPAGRIALADLTRFCRALTSTTVVSPVSRTVDPYASALAEGRREVWLYVMKQLNLDPHAAFDAAHEEDVLAA